VVALAPWGAEIVRLSGSVELAPLLDLAEIALDIVQTAGPWPKITWSSWTRSRTVAACLWSTALLPAPPGAVETLDRPPGGGGVAS